MEQTLFQEVNGGGDSASTHSTPGCPEAVVFFATVTESTGLTFYFAHPELPLKCGLEPGTVLRSASAFLGHLHAQDRMELEKSIARARVTKGSLTWEGRLVHPRGGFRWLRVDSAPQETPDGTRWDCFFADVTESDGATTRSDAFQEARLVLGEGEAISELLHGLTQVLSESLGHDVVALDWFPLRGTPQRAVMGLQPEEMQRIRSNPAGSIVQYVRTTGDAYECPDTRYGGSGFRDDPFVSLGLGGILVVPVLEPGVGELVISAMDWKKRRHTPEEPVLLGAIGKAAVRRFQEVGTRGESSQEDSEVLPFSPEVGAWEFGISAERTFDKNCSWIVSELARELLCLDKEVELTLADGIRLLGVEQCLRLRASILSRWESSEPFDLEIGLQNAEGEPRWLTTTVTVERALSPKYLRIFGVVRDITLQRLAEDALHRSQEEYRTLVESLPVGIAIIQRGVLGYVNGALIATLGQETEQALIRTPLEDWIHPDDRVGLAALIRDKEGELGATREIRFRHRTRGAITLSVSPVKHVRFRGKQGLLVMTRDITSEKELESKLYLADRVNTLGTMATGLAHEINNPLAYLMTNLEQASDSLEDWDGETPLDASWVTTVGNALRDARSGAQQVSSIVGDLKNFCRGGKPTLEHVCLEEVFSTTEVLALSHFRNRARLNLELDTVEPVHTCSTRLGQICLNLVLNAVQAFPTDDPALNHVTLHASLGSAGGLVLYVEDNGPGIPPHRLGRIFEPFFTAGKEGQGSGLGLAVCHQLVRSLGGTLQVDSEEGVGTRFTVVFPSEQGELSDVPVQWTPRENRPLEVERPARVLIVDDEERIGRALEKTLSGHTVRRTTRGLEALDWIRAGEHYDIVLCDIMMPELNGMDLLQRVRSEAPELESRFVFMTGGAFSSSARRFLDEITNPVLEKPFDLRALDAVVAASVLNAECPSDTLGA